MRNAWNFTRNHNTTLGHCQHPTKWYFLQVTIRRFSHTIKLTLDLGLSVWSALKWHYEGEFVAAVNMWPRKENCSTWKPFNFFPRKHMERIYCVLAMCFQFHANCGGNSNSLLLVYYGQQYTLSILACVCVLWMSWHQNVCMYVFAQCTPKQMKDFFFASLSRWQMPLR